MKAGKGKLSLQASTRPQLLHVHKRQGFTGGAEQQPVLQHHMAGHVQQPKPQPGRPISENALEPGTSMANKRAAPAGSISAFTALCQLCCLQDAAGVSRPVGEIKQQDPKSILPEQRNILVIPQS